MRRSSLLILSGLLAAGCQGAPPSPPPPPPLDADAELGRWVAMWNSYDLDEVSRLFLQDERVTYLSSEREGLIAGPVALREHHEGFGFEPGGRPAEQELWLTEIEPRQFDGAAVVTAVWFFGQRDDLAAAQRGPMTAVYVWTGEEYRLAHLHFANYANEE